jgi:NAD(P)-dependent dehydrogenase (short-subunit alcohol dehydrogenase family)
MIRAGAGKIVNIASFAGRLGFTFNGVHYGVLNAGLHPWFVSLPFNMPIKE